MSTILGTYYINMRDCSRMLKFNRPSTFADRIFHSCFLRNDSFYICCAISGGIIHLLRLTNKSFSFWVQIRDNLIDCPNSEYVTPIRAYGCCAIGKHDLGQAWLKLKYVGNYQYVSGCVIFNYLYLNVHFVVKFKIFPLVFFKN